MKKKFNSKHKFGGNSKTTIECDLSARSIMVTCCHTILTGTPKKTIPKILMYDYKRLLSMLFSPTKNETYIYMCVSAQFIQEFAA